MTSRCFVSDGRRCLQQQHIFELVHTWKSSYRNAQIKLQPPRQNSSSGKTSCVEDRIMDDNA